MPVLFGSATNGFGVRRLLKALRHETPGPDVDGRRGSGVEAPRVYAFKVCHGGTVGRLVLCPRASAAPDGRRRVDPGAGQAAARSAALFAVQGDKTAKVTAAAKARVIALAKVDAVKRRQWLGRRQRPPPPPRSRSAPRNAMPGDRAADRKDDVTSVRRRSTS